MSLQGQVEEIGLGPLIQTLSLNRYRGTLRVETEDAGAQFFFISEGQIELVRPVKKDPVRLGDLLTNAGKLSGDQLSAALAHQKQAGGRLGDVVVALGFVTREDIEAAVRARFEEEFLDLFLLDRGRFEFIFGLTPEALFSPDEKLERVTLSTSGLMLEAMRRLDEWQDMIKSLGSLDSIFRNRMHSMGPSISDYQFEKVDLPQAARERLYALLDGTRSLREILAAAIKDGIATRMQTFQFVWALCQNDLVKPLDFKTLMNEAKQALASGDVPGAAKYIRSILGKKERVDLGLLRRYLEFLRKHQRLKLAFHECRSLAAQALAREDHEQAIALYEEALGLGFRDVEVVDRLFYTLLRANKRERAIEVGLQFREYLATDDEVTVAARVVTNLEELDPENPEVIELAGLVLRRQEKNEEAVARLEKALARVGPTHPRRGPIIDALLELRPDRQDLVAERRDVEVREAQALVQRQARKRLALVGAALLVVLLGRFAWSELDARRAYDHARLLYEKDDPTTFVHRLNQANEKLTEAIAQGLTTVRGDARALKAKIDEEMQTFVDESLARRDEERVAAAERAREEAIRRERAAREEALAEGLAEYRRLVERGDHEAASARAVALHRDFAGEARLEEGPPLDVFVAIETTPPGAEVRVAGKAVGRSPLVLPLPLGQTLGFRVRLRGYEEAGEQVEARGFVRWTRTLAPGPVWARELPDDPLPPAVHGDRVLVGVPGEGVQALRLEDGAQLWAAPLEALFPAGAARLDSVVQVGDYLIAAAGSKLAAVELTDGGLEWQADLPGRITQPLVGTEVLREPLVLACAGNRLLVFEASSRALVLDCQLPAPASQPPCAGGGKAYIALADRSVVGVDLERRTGQIAWRTTGISAKGPPIHSQLAEAVLVPEERRVVSLGIRDGQVLTRLEPEVGVIRATALAPERQHLFVLGESGHLAAISVYDGQVRLRGTRLVQGEVTAGPHLLDGDVWLAERSGTLHQISPSGRRRGSFELGSVVTRPLLPVGGDRFLAVIGRKVCLIEPPTVQ